jgi:hypothetical protein
VKAGRPDWLTTGELFTEITRVGDWRRMTSKSFGRRLKNLESNLRPHMMLEFRDGPHNTTEVKITPTASTLERHAQSDGQATKEVKEVNNFLEKNKSGKTKY